MAKLNWLEKRAVLSKINRRMSARAARRMILGLNIPEMPAVLEVGCGPASALFEVMTLLKPRRASGLDIDAEMLEAARAEAEARGFTADFIEAGVESIPLADSSFDLVIGFEVLHHSEDWRKAVEEIARVLKPGGHFLSREAISPVRLRWLARLLHGIPTDFTWENYLAHCSRASLSCEESRVSFIHAEAIFIRE